MALATLVATPLAGYLGLPLATPMPTPSVSVVPPAVDKTGVGLIGFLIVLALIVVAIGLFFAMRGSLRRLRQQADEGTFGRPVGSRSARAGTPEDQPPA